jgi:hypothetical protein
MKWDRNGCYLRNYRDDECQGNSLFLSGAERLKPGESALLTIYVKLPDDLQGYSKLTMNFRFLQAVNTQVDQNGRPVKTYFGDNLVGIININNAKQEPLVYAPVAGSSMMQSLPPQPLTASSSVAKKKSDDLKLLEEIMIKRGVTTKEIDEIIGVGKVDSSS